ncbi:MAG: DNA polymerase domain-containing protein, partial [Candidatus Bathyarchaeia archaeon]
MSCGRELTSSGSRHGQRRIEGWLLDIYPRKGQMTLWIRTRDGCVRLSDPWQRHLYVSGPPQALADLAHRLGASGASYEKRRVRLQDWGPADVLKVPVNSSRGASALAEKILRLGGYAKFQLYNVDIPPDQMYLYQKGLFPLAYTEAWEGDRVKWRVLDSVEDIDYQTPPLTSLELRVEAGTSRLPRLQDPLRRIILQTPGEEVVIDAGDEEGKLLALCEAVRRLDPDVITTRGGNAFTLPYLARRAAENQVEGRFILGREEAPTRPAPPGGASYFSYGRVYYRPRAARILGRLHVDLESSPLYPSCGLEGIIEVSRVCRMPLQRAVNSTIGSVMTSLQMYHAVRSGLLIPWRKTEAEEFKTARELLLADRGGFIYEPRIGAHDDVWEIDFASLYPMIMMRRNISPETVSCTCCPDSPHRVPELGTPICQRRRGFIPSLLELLIRKRLDYKRMRDAAPDEGLRTVYDRRQAALKWILVTCFGYLGFRNASFGKIDAHIATCAFARDVLVRASRLAEERGFQILHGIVDCLWLKKPGSDPGDLDELCA